MTTRQKRTKRVAARMVDEGYRVTGQRQTYRTFTAAIQAAWQTCIRTGADLYAITPEGKWVLMMRNASILADERDRLVASALTN